MKRAVKKMKSWALRLENGELLRMRAGHPSAPRLFNILEEAGSLRRIYGLTKAKPVRVTITVDG